MSAPKIAIPGCVQRETEEQRTTQPELQQGIANLAYALWQQRGSPQGSPERDWIEAEQKLQNEQWMVVHS